MSKISYNQKKVAFIGQKGFPPEFSGTSGVERYVEYAMHRLTRTKRLIICYTRSWTPSQAQRVGNVYIHPLPSINTKHLDAITHSLLATIHAVFVEKVNEVWFQGVGPGALGVITKLFGIKSILTIHSLDWERKKWGTTARIILRVCERIAIAHADTVRVVSKKIQKYVESQHHREAMLDQLMLPQRSKPPMRSAITLLRTHNTKPFHYVLFMGRFVPEKRIEWAIHAFEQLRSSGLRLLIAGGGSHSGEYTRRMLQIAQRNTRIRFVGYMFGKEKSILLAYAKFLILPSETEGLPVVVAEALQFNTPCLVPDFLKNEYPTNKPIYYFQHQSYEDFLNIFIRLIRTSRS